MVMGYGYVYRIYSYASQIHMHDTYTYIFMIHVSDMYAIYVL